MRAPRLLTLTVVGLVAVLAACPTPVPTYDYSREPDPSRSPYVLGIGDHVTINVWENPNLSTDGVIRPDGTITMPLIGDLHASGETTASLKAQIKARLADFIKLNAGSEITVAVRQASSYRITISGEVNHPGVINADHYVTIAEAIAQAGGFTRFADRNNMKLQRRDPKTGRVRAIPLVYDLLVDGTHPEMNLTMIAGDSLFVP
jgi:polysaccharide biosynthesis/export protein